LAALGKLAVARHDFVTLLSHRWGRRQQSKGVVKLLDVKIPLFDAPLFFRKNRNGAQVGTGFTGEIEGFH
jgi:hypothetical protein